MNRGASRRGAGVLVVLALLIVWPLYAPGRAAAPQSASQTLTYFCPMHPHVRMHGPGPCPLCRMVLVQADPLDVREYRLEMTTAPSPPPPDRSFRLRLAVRNPDTDEVVRDFAIVHERPYHLFVIGQDLEHYAHLHPEQGKDGSFVLDLTLPRAGYYKIFSDFLPGGGTPQVIGRALVTRGFSGDLASSAARLVPDRVLQKTVAGMVVQLELPPDGLIAGRDEAFLYRLSDAKTGAPLSDLEPYLGAWGHSVVMSADTLSFVHAHPIELLPDPAPAAGGGPTLTFRGLLPKPGMYRMWTQLKRRGEVVTVPFTVAVASSASATR